MPGTTTSTAPAIAAISGSLPICGLRARVERYRNTSVTPTSAVASDGTICTATTWAT
jgi:hypothetical protein